MKIKSTDIRFFSAQENEKPKEQKALKAVLPTGYVSMVGKLVFPDKVAAGLGIDFDTMVVKIGVQDGKNKPTSLYLVQADADDADTFSFRKATKGYVLGLAVILQKIGVNYKENHYDFAISSLNADDAEGLQLQLAAPEARLPKPPYTGKPRGRKRAVAAE
jgi:hypothetical protein